MTSFRPGDKVRHRASGEEAIVVRELMQCSAKHGDRSLSALLYHVNAGWHTDECQMEPTGKYALSRGFDADDIEVDGALLELVSSEAQPS